MAPTSEQQMLEKLDQILRVLAALATRGLKQREQIALLDQVGLQPKTIAELLGTSSNTIRVGLVSLRKGKSKRGRASGK